MATRLIIDGNSVYEIDETCKKEGQSTNSRIRPEWMAEQMFEQMSEKERQGDKREGFDKKGGG